MLTRQLLQRAYTSSTASLSRRIAVQRAPSLVTTPTFRTSRSLHHRTQRPYCQLHSGTTPIMSGTATTASLSPEEVHLPRTALPSHYNVVIKTDLTTSPPSYAGEIAVTLDVQEDVSELHFSVHHLVKITHIAVSSSDLKTNSSVVLPLDALKTHKETERGVIDLKSLPGGGLKAGTKDAKVWFRFESPLADNMMGYYVSEADLDEKTGKKPIYALTQFESVGARRAFPCWDQPAIKAPWTVSMIAPDNLVVLSNMPDTSSKTWNPSSSASPENVFSESYELGSLIDAGSSSGKTESSSNLKITHFQKSPPMSTYLVAFACGDFVHLSSEVKSSAGNTIPLRIFATAPQIKQAQFGLDIKKWALPIYEEVFDIPFALPKLDTLVAHDFDAGAMENWGLITGRTTAYLYDPAKSSLASKKRVATVQCHELAHMWFGDIVTMKWWDNLWLNESFATIMGELVIPDRIWPEWNVRQEFLNSHLSSALALDAQRSSHPIEMPCPTEDTINQIFDSISYSKGASVLRMLSSVVGEEKFLKGVSIYLKKHLFGNAQTKDLWAGITEASGIDVASIMANWTLKTGFPVLSVEEQGNGKVKVTQNRFLSTGDVKPEEDETLWWVPLELKTVSGGKTETDHKAVLKERSAEIDVGSADHFKLNGDTVGVYRVKYSAERLAKLGKDAQSFSLEDRVGLVSDATTLARAGYSKTSGSLSLVNELAPSEKEKLPLEQVAAAVAKLATVWWEQPEDVRKAISALRIKLFKPVVERMGWEHGPNDTPDQQELRAIAVGEVVNAEDPDALAEVRRRFAPFLEKNDDSLIPADIQRTIYTSAVKHGGEKEYKKMLDVYNNPPNPSTKVDAMVGMSMAQGDEQIKETFDMLIDTKRVKNQDIYIFFGALASNRKTRRQVGEWFITNHKELIRRAEGTMGAHYLIRMGFNTLSSHEDLERLKKFFATIDQEKFKMTIAQLYDTIQASADWLARDKSDVEAWLKENKFL